MLKSTKFNFAVDKSNSLTCTYNDGKGNFKVKLPYHETEPQGGIPEQDTKDLAAIVKLFSEHPNRESGTFPKHILDQAKGAAVPQIKAYKVSTKYIYFSKENWQVCEGEIDLSNQNVKKARIIQTDMLPEDMQVVYHPTVGGGVSLVHKGHLITGGAHPDFDSDDIVMNFLNSVAKIGPDVIKAKADQLVSQRGKENNVKVNTSTDKYLQLRKESEAMHELLKQDETIYDSWGAEKVQYTSENDQAGLRFIVHGFLHIGPVEVVKTGKTFTVRTIEGTSTKAEKTGIKPAKLVDTIDSMVEYPGDQKQYEELCKAFNGIVEEESEKAKKAA